MPPRSNFPIGIHHYIDYLNANVNQLNLYNIPHSRDQTSGDSEPGSPASSHGGDRTAQTALIPVNTGADVEHDQLFSNSPFPDQGPRVSAQSNGSATGVNSTFLSTSSQPRPTSASEREEYRYTASPTESVHSDHSASFSAYSGYSSGHSAQSESSDGHYDPDTTQRLPTHPQLYRRQDDHGNIEYRPPAPDARPQHYYRMSEDGYQGVLAPEVLDADADIPGVSSQGSSPGSPTLYTIASSSTSSTPAVGIRHLPWPSIQPPPSIEAEQYLRHQMSLPRDKPVDLWALKDPPNRGKPGQPYPELIKLAIFGSSNKKLTLQEIYKALIDRFEWFKDNSGEMAWKNSIRHNLSLNKVFVNIPRPITEPGKGSYWRLDLSKGEGYKRPRIRKSRAQQREAAQQLMAQQRADGANAAPSRGGVSSRTASSSAHSQTTTSSIEDANIDPQLRDQGHRVGERRIRSTPRRTEAVSPYPLRKTPSPVLSLVTSRRQQREQQTMSEPLATGYSSSSSSAPPSPLQPQNLQSRQQTQDTAETTSPYLSQETSSPVLGSPLNQRELRVSEQLTTGHSSSLRSVPSSPQQNTGPRVQGHRVGERRVRPTTRRTNTSSPYTLHNAPSPVRPLIGSRQQNLPESLAYGHLPGSRSRPSSPLQNLQSRDQGHRVGEGRVRPATRRADTSSPYPLRKTPSPVLPLHLQRELLPEVSEPLAQYHSSDSRSELLSPLQMPRDLLVELSAPVAQPQYGQPPMGQPPPGHSYFVEPSFMPPFGQSSLPSSTLGQSWIPPSTVSPSFNAHGHLSLSSNTARDSSDRGLDKSSIEYIADHGLPRVRRVNASSSRPASLSPPVGDDGSCHYNTRAPTDGTYYDNDGSDHPWNE